MGGPCDKTQEQEGLLGFRDVGEYYRRTDSIFKEHGNQSPNCHSCREPLTPIDDHGRFTCFDF
jgi:hypothetical protein